MKSRITGVIVGAVALIFTSATQAQNGVEPRYERYNADRKSIEVDGDLSDWAGVSFIEPRFEASDNRETGKGNSTIGDVTYSTFAEYAGGTWSGPEDHTTLTAVAWDQNGLYLGIVVTDDEHEHAANNAWNGDGVQMGLTDADRSTVTHLYNYCIKDGYESGKVYKNGDAGIIADKERGPGNYSVAMVRDDAKKTTTYEALFTPDSFGFAKFEVGQQFGFGVCVNDGDKDTPGQKGWSGWGPHMIVFGKTAPDAALVTLTAAEVLASFETDFSDGEIPDTAELFGTATIGPDELDEADEPNEFLHVTDALNGQNGSMKIQDITDGRTFKEFEVGFRLYISDSTCCGDADDTSPAHRPADGWSLSIGNELPDTIGLPEEGTGSGIRICFDTWDSGGGEAPAIDVWNGVEGEVGDGNQDAWSGGLFVRQKFDGVTAAKDEEKFTDPDTGEFVFMWTHGEWVDFSLKVYSGRIVINYKGYEMINEELPAGWPALTAPQWLFAGRTGGANSAHWVDDFYVKVFKPSGPIISAFEGTAGGFSVSLVDAEGNGLEVDSVKAKFDGADIVVTKSKSDGETTISYSTDSSLPSASEHTIELTYSDEKGSVHVKTLSFSVPKYIILNADSIVSDSIKGESGFIANITQISTEQTGKVSLHNNSTVNAEKQLNGEYIDPDYEEPWLNEADLDAEEGWSYYPVWVETVNQNQDAPAPVGNFSSNNGYEDEYIPGIPGWYDSTDGIVGEYLALLQLDEGAYTLGVNSDDGFKATIGANFNDIWSQEIGGFDGGRGASDTIIDIFVDKAGLYPFRVLWYEGGGGANIEIFSMVDGEKVLINDPDVEGSIKAYIPEGATVDESIPERDATTGRAAVVSIMPTPGQKRVEPTSSIEVVIENGSATSVDQSSVKMSVNGKDVAVDVSRSGDVVTIAHTPDGDLAGEANTAIVSFKESNGTERSAEWSFEVKVTKPAATLASFLIDFGGTAANSAGASPDPWISLDNLVMDEAADLGDGVTLTALDDGFSPNNPAQPGEDAEHDGVVVPQEARNDYFFKITDTAGTTARMRIDGLPAGVYNVTVFEGRTTDGNQVAKIWTGEEPEEENTGNFAQGSATVEVNVIAGEPLWYMHLEDNTGGVSGMIIRKTSEPGITWDFNDGLPEGSEVAGNAEHSEDEGVDDSGALVITRALNSQLGGWLSPEIGTVSSFIIDFDILIDGGTDTQADGISMAISDDLVPFEEFSEAGRGSGLRVNFDNWDNGDGAPSIEIEFGGVQIAAVPMGTQADSTLDTDGWWPVRIELTTAGDLTLLYNDELIHDSVNIEDFAPIENARIAFGGRTGGANANQFIDNFRIVLDAGSGGPISGLIAHFTLDSDGDSSDGNFTASTVTDVEFGSEGANGATGTSATFNGASSVIQHDWSADLNPESFTLALWAKSNGGAGAWNSPVTSRHDLNPDSQGYLIYDNNPNGVWTFWSGNGTVDGNWQALDGPEVNLGEWEHVAITYDNESEMKRLYVNGELAVEANDSVFPNDTTPFNIGAGQDMGNGFWFKGDLDDIGLWDRALSLEDIQAIMNNGVAGDGGGDGGGRGDLVDVSASGDEVVASSDNSPGGEQAPNAIDNNDQTKYLNFDGANNQPSGLTITTSGGVVTGLGLTSANDAPDRDPASFVLSGSNDAGATFTEIASGDISAFGDRFELQEVFFANDEAYTTYELIFPTTTGPSTCCMQIAEIELLGTPADAPEPLLPPELPWSVGMNDDGWPAGNGGGANTTFVQESGANELPGDPASPEVAQQGDDDYYWAGVYSTVIAGNGDYEPVGEVPVNEESAERAFAGIDNDLRYHFNLPESLGATDSLTVSYDALNLHGDQDDSRYGIEVYVNNVLVQPEVVIRPEQLGQTYNTDPFTLAEVNAEVGLGYDNIITLKGVNYNAEGGGNWMGIDYVQLSKVAGALTEPTVVDFGDLSGDTSYEFFFNAIKAGASTAIAGNNAFAFKLDQWNEQGVFGTTVFGVVDNVFTAVEGKSVASVFDRDVHVVLVNDTAAGETRLYVDGDHVGVLDGNFELAGEAKVMGARIEANTDPMGDGSVMHKWAVYNSALSGAEIADLAAAAGGGGGDAPALSIVNNGDGTVTVTFEGTLQSADSVNGPWSDVEGATSPLTLPAEQAAQFGRAKN